MPSVKTTRLALAAVLVGGMLSANPAAAAFAPEGAPVSVSDGESRVAGFTADGSAIAVYDADTGTPIGAPIPVPKDPTLGPPKRWIPMSFTEGRVYLYGNSQVGQQDRLGFADTTTGTFRVVCSPLPSEPACPTSPGTTARTIAIGRRWILDRTATPTDGSGADIGLALLRYRPNGAGFAFTPASKAQTRRFHRDVPLPDAFAQPIDADGTRLTLDRRWGYGRSVSSLPLRDAGHHSPAATRVFLKRAGDRRPGAIDIRRATSTTSHNVAFGSRGLCASTGTRIVLWDQRNRRIWTRPIPADYPHYGPRALCTASRVLLGVNGSPGPFGPVWTWPTLRAQAGWTKGPKLTEGRTRRF